MANVYVEARPKGRTGSRIDDYVVEDLADHVLGTFQTQHEAIRLVKRSAGENEQVIALLLLAFDI